MSKVAVIYYSMTGNTQMMAEALNEQLLSQGHESQLFTSDTFDVSTASDFDGFALGCSAMGDEELESESFAPMFEALKPSLASKTVVLFGSYGWGTGEWMEKWKEDCTNNGVDVKETLIVNNTPDDAGLQQSRDLANQF